MGSTQSTWGVTLKILWTQLFNMYKLVIASVLAVASSLPIEDTAEVAAAKEAFNAVFVDAEAGGLAAKQAAQIADSFLADDEAVAAAKAEFLAAFADAEAGGLSAKQAPAPVHEIPAPAPLAAPLAAALPYAGYPYGINALNVLGAYPGYGYAAGLPYAAYPYAGLPVVAAPAAKA